MINQIAIQGRLTADPEMKSIPSGTPLCNITIACDRPKSKDGSQQTDFIPCIAWSKTAEFLQKYFHKGDMILISGRLQSRAYETQDGKKRNAYEVSISEVHFCGGNARQTQQAPADRQPEATEEDEDLDDLDLPF